MTITATSEIAQILDRRILDSATEMRDFIESCGYMVAVRAVGLSVIAVTAMHAERPTVTAKGNTLHSALGWLVQNLGMLGRLA